MFGCFDQGLNGGWIGTMGVLVCSVEVCEAFVAGRRDGKGTIAWLGVY